MTHEEWEERINGLEECTWEIFSGQVVVIEPYPEGLTGWQKLHYPRKCVVKTDVGEIVCPYD